MHMMIPAAYACWLEQQYALSLLGALTPTAGTIPYFSAADEADLATITAFGRSLIDDADAPAARSTLGLGSIATQDASAVAITGGSIAGIVDLAVADGGTGASTAADARANLGLAIGTNVQAQNANLSALAGLAGSASKLAYFTGAGAMALTDLSTFGRSLVDDADAPAARVTLGLGTAAVATVTTSPTDSTAGRVLKVGDSATLLSASPALRMAVGGTADAITLATGAGITGTPPAGLRLRFLASAANTGAATIALDGGTALACRTITGAALPAGYLRTDTDTVATFDGTYWVLDRQTERGSNANGEYTRWADGRQVCALNETISVTTAASGSLHNQVVAAWTYPAAFVAAPSPAFSARGANVWGTIGGAVSASSCPRNVLAGAALSAASINTFSTALGRWY